MEMCYAGGALVMPSNFAVMSEEEMMYTEGGGVLKVNYKITVTKNLIKACISAGVGVIVGALTSLLTIKLGLASIAIGAVTSAISSLLMSYICDTKLKNIKDKTFSGQVKCSVIGSNTNISITSKIGW